MTLQALSKYLDKYDGWVVYNTDSIFELLKGLPFYNWNNNNKQQHNLQTDPNVINFNHGDKFKTKEELVKHNEVTHRKQ